MTSALRSVDYGSQTITFRLVRRNRRTLQISVLPDMSVEVVAPCNANDKDITARILKKAPWILRQKLFFGQFHPRTPDRRYVSGETHLYLGRRYRLKVRRAIQAQVRVSRGYIEVDALYPDREDSVRLQFEEWLKKRAKEYFTQRLNTCLARFDNPDMYRPRGLIIRHLKQRWGSMTRAGRLVLNRSLMQAHIREIDYVITHELCHRTHHHHGRQFFDLLNRVMPDWEARKSSLERRLA